MEIAGCRVGMTPGTDLIDSGSPYLFLEGLFISTKNHRKGVYSIKIREGVSLRTLGAEKPSTLRTNQPSIIMKLLTFLSTTKPPLKLIPLSSLVF